jgi:uncharacterized protein YecE (DUF72 family)
MAKGMGTVRPPLAASILPAIGHPTRRPLARHVTRLHCESSLPRAPKTIAAAASALAPSPRNLFVGTSGWAYPTWKPGFYPADIPSHAFLHFYAARLTSVEVNYTFRTLPTLTQLQGWLDATPPNFRFSFKAPQRITHFQRLRQSSSTLAEFIAAITPAHTAGKLGPLLFQLPPNFAADPARLDTFLGLSAFTSSPHLQIAFEFRHPSWFTDATCDVLRHYNAALCVAESNDLVTPDIATANFHCYRLRRDGGYTSTELSAFAKRFTKLASKSELYAYFKHEDEPTAALNASALLAATPKPKAASKAGARK